MNYEKKKFKTVQPQLQIPQPSQRPPPQPPQQLQQPQPPPQQPQQPQPPQTTQLILCQFLAGESGSK